MSEEDEIELANSFIRAGEIKKGTDMLTSIFHNTRDKTIRLNLAHSLSTILSMIDDRDTLEAICKMGTSMAHDLGELRLKAYFMSKRANILMLDLTRDVYALKNLKLAPNWIGFSLISEQDEYERLEKIIRLKEKEINKLSRKSVEIAESNLDQNAIGHVYMLQGDVESSKYLLEKSKNISGAKLFMFLHRWNLDDFAYKRKVRKLLKKHLMKSEENFLKAVKAFRKADNEIYAGYALYNLSNCLTTAGRFRRAKKYLAEAEQIAKQHDENEILERIKHMKERIKSKNMNIPDYINS